MEPEKLLTDNRTGNQMDGLLAALKAVGEPTRLRLVQVLAQDELTVSELVHDLDRLAGVKRARADAAAAYFHRNAESWDKLRSLHIDDREVEKVIVKLLQKHGIENLLDLGTGTGRMLELLAPHAERGLGIDLSRQMLEVARSNLERTGASNCQVRQADITHLPYPEKSFDAVTIHQVLHFLDEPAAAIAEAARVLAPGGRLVVIDFLPHMLENLREEQNHRRLGFAGDEIESWFAGAGLKGIKSEHLAGEPLTVAVWLAEKLETEGTP